MASKNSGAETQRSVSIAWKMTWSFTGRLFAILLTIDIILLAAVAVLFCYTQEKQVLQEAWQWHLERGIRDWTYQFGLPGQSMHSVDLRVYQEPAVLALSLIHI